MSQNCYFHLQKNFLRKNVSEKTFKLIKKFVNSAKIFSNLSKRLSRGFLKRLLTFPKDSWGRREGENEELHVLLTFLKLLAEKILNVEKKIFCASSKLLATCPEIFWRVFSNKNHTYFVHFPQNVVGLSAKPSWHFCQNRNIRPRETICGDILRKKL